MLPAAPVPPRTLLLDLGRVLVDFDFESLGERLAGQTGLEVEEVRAAFAADGLARRYESGLVDDRQFHDEISRRLGRALPWREFVEAWNSVFDPAPILPEALIAGLARRAALWVVSNTNRLHFDFIRERYPLLRHFRGYVLSHEVGALKPDARIFEVALERAASRPAETLFVDDLAVNVEGARRLGIEAFQFQGRAQFENELARRGLS
jgi:putative hydrolase of the HAD superfamily